MGVYIKGIGLPNDYNIEFYIIEPDGTVLNSDNRCVGAAVEIKEPHGDLIDANDLVKQMKKDHPQTSKATWFQILAKYARVIVKGEG